MLLLCNILIQIEILSLNLFLIYVDKHISEHIRCMFLLYIKIFMCEDMLVELSHSLSASWESQNDGFLFTC